MSLSFDRSAALIAENAKHIAGGVNSNFRIGMATLNEPFSGNMADLLVASSSLTQAQVQQLYNNGLTFGTFNGPSGSLSPTSGSPRRSTRTRPRWTSRCSIRCSPSSTPWPAGP